MTKSRQEHWERIHRDKRPDEVSWHEDVPAASLELIEAAGIQTDAALVDVGGGISRLADHLLDRGYSNITVVDIAAAALGHAQQRLGARAEQIRWVVGDVLEHDLGGPFDLWHDRAVFHFLTDEQDRQRYVAQLNRHLAPGGCAVIATFAADGPTRCSGLPVVRYDPPALAAELGDELELVEHRHLVHRTPSDKDQRFTYCLLRKTPAAA